jgi:hypothetical protein
MYKTEQKFSQALLTVLKKRYPIVQRIESAETGVGIPDIMIAKKGVVRWLELKNDYRQHLKQSVYRVPWRKGQQGWLYNYSVTTGFMCATVMALQDGIIVIPSAKLLKSSGVPHEAVMRMTSLKDVLDSITIIGDCYG